MRKGNVMRKRERGTEGKDGRYGVLGMWRRCRMKDEVWRRERGGREINEDVYG